MDVPEWGLSRSVCSHKIIECLALMLNWEYWSIIVLPGMCTHLSGQCVARLTLHWNESNVKNSVQLYFVAWAICNGTHWNSWSWSNELLFFHAGHVFNPPIHVFLTMTFFFFYYVTWPAMAVVPNCLYHLINLQPLT